ncbi:MAG TPA: RDD family protein [Steroidobacteraceae bacterium]|nr:RDD family protein [Steroidobacteraceae bacterium]
MDPADIDDGLKIRSVTGVDFTLPIAGIGGRGFAFLIDLHIRALGALLWVLLAQLVVSLAFSRTDRTVMLWVGLPASAIFFLYHPIIELLMGGRSPGKRIAGVRVIMRDGSPPGAGAILIRNVFRLLDSLPIGYWVGLIACFVTDRQVRVGDMAAGTLLIYDEGPTRESVDLLAVQGTAAGLSAAQAELLDDLLARWDSLEPAARLQIARQAILQFEPGATEESALVIGERDALRRLSALLRPVAAVTPT